MIYGPKDDGRYVAEFQIAEVDVLAISSPRTEAAMIGIFRSECRMAVCSGRVPGRLVWHS